MSADTKRKRAGRSAVVAALTAAGFTACLLVGTRTGFASDVIVVPDVSPSVPAPAMTDRPTSPAEPGAAPTTELPDLDCSDIPERNFPQASPDIHDFDRDSDGIGCESPGPDDD